MVYSLGASSSLGEVPLHIKKKKKNTHTHTHTFPTNVIFSIYPTFFFFFQLKLTQVSLLVHFTIMLWQVVLYSKF